MSRLSCFLDCVGLESLSEYFSNKSATKAAQKYLDKTYSDVEIKSVFQTSFRWDQDSYTIDFKGLNKEVNQKAHGQLYYHNLRPSQLTGRIYPDKIFEVQDTRHELT